MKTRLPSGDGRNCCPSFYQASSCSLDHFQLFVTGTRTDLGPVKATQIEVPTAPSTKDKAGCPLIAHLIKQTKTMYILRSDVALPVSTFADRCFMELSVVSPDHLHEVPSTI